MREPYQVTKPQVIRELVEEAMAGYRKDNTPYWIEQEGTLFVGYTDRKYLHLDSSKDVTTHRPRCTECSHLITKGQRIIYGKCVRCHERKKLEEKTVSKRGKYKTTVKRNNKRGKYNI